MEEWEVNVVKARVAREAMEHAIAQRSFVLVAYLMVAVSGFLVGVGVGWGIWG